MEPCKVPRECKHFVNISGHICRHEQFCAFILLLSFQFCFFIGCPLNMILAYVEHSEWPSWVLHAYTLPSA